MRDPFADLRAADAPVDPDPQFAVRLRARLERALALPRGVVPVTASEAPPAPRPAAVPYLAVIDARAAIDWYTDVFDAQVQGEPIVMPDGRVGHAELEISGGLVYLADAHPEIGVTAPRPGEAPVSLMLPVDDADAVRARAMAAGADGGHREPYDGYGQRNAWIVDPFGHRWGLHSPLPTLASAPRYRHGDVGHVSLNIPDAARAAAFYATALGWTYTDFERPRVHGATPSTGMWETDERPTLFCAFAVDDVREAVRRVREAGGSAGEPEQQQWGRTADCTDDQGTKFALFEQPDEVTGDRPPPNGRRAGDVSYLTVEVVDSARARAFYGAVLGWQFTHGRIEDGWQVADTVPMIGMSGGHDRATIVPMWKVPDVRGAVEAVRAAGGTATDPERQPYGTTSECTDDQGMRFYVGDA
jgi:predicted enzyme related to lactoylglutathione lyase